jgi:putative ABC transport system ATP-binding protein
MIEVDHISKTFTNEAGSVTAVVDATMHVPQGQFASIIGKSGSGKSTLLSLLGALDIPTGGKIVVDGQDITAMSSKQLARYRSQKIGYVFQAYNLVPNLSALENVMLPMEFAGVTKKDRLPRATQLLERVGIDEEARARRPGKLSGGQQQRVAIARALANQPTLILADEPTGNLDAATGKMIFDLLHGLCKTEKTTIIVVTHDLEIAGKTDVTFQITDGKLIRRQGR